VHFAFWIVLVGAVLVLGAIALGAYLVAARKLYSKDREVVATGRGESAAEIPAPSPKKGSGEGVHPG
jgi:hypothetical protein